VSEVIKELRMKKEIWISVILLAFTVFPLRAQNVHIVGAMKNVMRKGELFATIDIDTLSKETNLYGMGPVEYLKGEITVVNGRCFKSTVQPNGEMKVEETFEVKAPFFGYAQIEKWEEVQMPDSVHTIKQLEKFLNASTLERARPYFFKLKGEVDFAKIHVVNLPKGSVVHSPEEAHVGQANYSIKNKYAEIIGFFSTEHQTIFTHHSTFVHMHLITDDLLQMGHVDELQIQSKNLHLYLQ
jgi:acetolactate decarboxylase